MTYSQILKSNRGPTGGVAVITNQLICWAKWLIYRGSHRASCRQSAPVPPGQFRPAHWPGHSPQNVKIIYYRPAALYQPLAFRLRSGLNFSVFGSLECLHFVLLQAESPTCEAVLLWSRRTPCFNDDYCIKNEHEKRHIRLCRYILGHVKNA